MDSVKSRADPSSGPCADPTVFRGLDLAVVLPTLNEEHGLPVTLKGIPFLHLLEKGRRVRVLVIDGGSTDRTVAVARSLGIQVIRQHGKGKGQAVREAIAWLRECGTRYAVIMDADSTYPGDMVGAVLELLEAGSHLVVGAASFSCTFTVPNGTSGASVVATDVGGQTATGTFMVVSGSGPTRSLTAKRGTSSLT